jgi:hypothetical protein
MNIEFFPNSEETYNDVPSPTSAKNFIPQWYKDIKPVDSLNVKNCMPFLDTLSSGYVQTTWEDIYVEKTENSFRVHHKDAVPLFKTRDVSDISIAHLFYPIEFVWQRYWSIKLPKGYSALVTHPLNRYDLPFVTLSGIVDFDNYSNVQVGSLPFYLYQDFEGLIPKGTPMFQIIPIKREDWTAVKKEYNEEYWNEKTSVFSDLKSGVYKKMFWEKKSFE